MNLNETLQLLSQNPWAQLDVAEIALHLARDEFPHLDVEAYLGELDGMAHEARRYLTGKLPSRLTGLCRYLFHELGFRGNQAHYYDPYNSYLNIVLDRRTGIPITLCILAMSVGQRAGLDVQGIGLPGHFVAKAIQGQKELLFDPFHGGRQLQPKDCENLVLQVTGMSFQADRKSLQPISLGLLVQRMLNNLKAIYLQQADFSRGIRIIKRLQRLNPLNPLHDRDLGACYLQEGQPGKAIDHLQIYLKQMPQAEDVETVKKLLRQAERDIALWN